MGDLRDTCSVGSGEYIFVGAAISFPREHEVDPQCHEEYVVGCIISSGTKKQYRAQGAWVDDSVDVKVWNKTIVIYARRHFIHMIEVRGVAWILREL